MITRPHRFPFLLLGDETYHAARYAGGLLFSLTCHVAAAMMRSHTGLVLKALLACILFKRLAAACLTRVQKPNTTARPFSNRSQSRLVETLDVMLLEPGMV